ncbi:hypothetical protein AXA84_0468 [Candidatus Phytoplasma oryzae]|uniref:Uncharacterized protein n=1 Tax=Candidatus Phytoplasma oryzae TaxID=203274 RepID=A0A139JQ12_9MOLU|nr:hypothetical protein AXA84_0468 [Candidatus Phytoplasma oryzae]RAM57652.1 hypothetical protein DH96_02240 [Candidatus Phytoplasma oryzae]
MILNIKKRYFLSKNIFKSSFVYVIFLFLFLLKFNIVLAIKHNNKKCLLSRYKTIENIKLLGLILINKDTFSLF